MPFFAFILIAFPLAGQPGVIMSDRPQTPIEEPRGPDGRVISPYYNGYTPPGKPSVECWQQTNMCYGSDGSMTPMMHKNADKPIRKKPVSSLHKLSNGDTLI